MFKIFIIALLTINCYPVHTISKSNLKLFDTLTSGVKFTENLINMDYANGVTKLVSDAFKNLTTTKNGMKSAASEIFTGFIKILGFDSKKIGAIGINGLIFLAQLVSSTLSI